MSAYKKTFGAHASSPAAKVFPAEADCDFDVVKPEDIAGWKQRLTERFGLGTGRLVTIEDPVG